MWLPSLLGMLLHACALPAVLSFRALNHPFSMWQVLCSGVATPGDTRACAHVKFTGAQVKIMWKAKDKDQLLACAIAFMWT